MSSFDIASWRATSIQRCRELLEQERPTGDREELWKLQESRARMWIALHTFQRLARTAEDERIRMLSFRNAIQLTAKVIRNDEGEMFFGMGTSKPELDPE